MAGAGHPSGSRIPSSGVGGISLVRQSLAPLQSAFLIKMYFFCSWVPSLRAPGSPWAGDVPGIAWSCSGAQPGPEWDAVGRWMTLQQVQAGGDRQVGRVGRQVPAVAAATCSPGSRDQPWGQGEEPLIPQYPASSPSPAKAPGCRPVLWSDPLQWIGPWGSRELWPLGKESTPDWVLGVLGHKCRGTRGAGSGVHGSDPSFLNTLPRGCKPW